METRTEKARRLEKKHHGHKTKTDRRHRGRGKTEENTGREQEALPWLYFIIFVHWKGTSMGTSSCVGHMRGPGL